MTATNEWKSSMRDSLTQAVAALEAGELRVSQAFTDLRDKAHMDGELPHVWLLKMVTECEACGSKIELKLGTPRQP